MNDFLKDSRFAGIEPFPSKVWLSSPTMHGEECRWVDNAILTNWVSTGGANIIVVEEEIAEYVGVKYAVGLSAGTASLHLTTKKLQAKGFMDRQDLMREPFADEKCSVLT